MGVDLDRRAAPALYADEVETGPEHAILRGGNEGRRGTEAVVLVQFHVILRYGLALILQALCSPPDPAAC